MSVRVLVLAAVLGWNRAVRLCRISAPTPRRQVDFGIKVAQTGPLERGGLPWEKSDPNSIPLCKRPGTTSQSLRARKTIADARKAYDKAVALESEEQS